MERELFDRPTQVAEAVIVVAVALVIVVDVLIVARSGRVGAWQFEAAVGAAAWALVLVRRRRPIAAAAAGVGLLIVAALVAVLTDLPSQPGLGPTIAMLVLTGTCLRTARPPLAFGVALSGLVLLVVGHVGGVRTSYLLPLAVVGVLAWGAAAAIGLWLRSADTQRRGVLDATRENERLALARELHDVVGHHIAGLLVQTQGTRLVRAADPALADSELDRDLADIETSAATAMTAMRSVVGLLRGETPWASEQIAAIVDRFERHGPTVTRTLPDDTTAWPAEVVTTVTRVVQEALTNITLHAPTACAVAVTVRAEQGAVHVEVTDDATPAPDELPEVTRRTGYGLTGLRERVESLGGQLTAGAYLEGGWQVRASVPLTHAGAPR